MPLIGDHDLAAISNSISATARQVFVYDTRKDSDGGAWRKRTSHTSWYNETLNTSYRGSRKEFPVVAILVTTENQLWIYDADDPTLPMWMGFSVGGSNTVQTMLNRGDNFVNSVCAVNGIIIVGTLYDNNYAGGLRRINFIADNCIGHSTSVEWMRGYFKGNISQRNVSMGYSGGGSSTFARNILDLNCYDVDARVLPNAPVDPDTGLPKPTIVTIGTGGISIINNDDTVWTNSAYDGYKCAFLDNDSIVCHAFVNYSPADYVYVIPSTGGSYTRSYTTSSTPRISGFPGSNGGFHNDIVCSPNKIHGANYRDGSNLHTPLVNVSLGSSQSKDMVNYIGTDFNSGWLPGDIRLATLSMTDDTDLSAGTYTQLSEDFSVDENWGHAGTSISGGVLNIDGTTQSSRATWAGWTTSYSGEYMLMVIEGASSSNWGNLVVDDDGSGAGLGSVTTYVSNLNSDGTKYYWFKKTASQRIRIMRTGGGPFTIDGIKIYRVVQDHSHIKKGLQVNGTVPVGNVNGSSDLVYFGPFGSMYLSQPYTGNLDFGTSDFCFMVWCKGVRRYEVFASYGNNSSTSGNLIIQTGGAYEGDDYRIYINGTGFTSNRSYLLNNSYGTNGWVFYTVKRESGVLSLYHNGVKFQETSSLTGSIGSSSNTLNIGTAQNTSTAQVIGNDQLDNGIISLLRFAGSAPSDEQIRQIYQDELPLFAADAQCTLYGSSDSISALAYDDDTELLYAGTSAGTSIFNGLTRVDNTTDAVTTSLSASGGVVAEQ